MNGNDTEKKKDIFATCCLCFYVTLSGNNIFFRILPDQIVRCVQIKMCSHLVSYVGKTDCYHDRLYV